MSNALLTRPTALHRRCLLTAISAALLILPHSACKRGETIVERGRANQTLHVGNGQEPQELDPHIITGVSEIKILSALFEGLVGQDPVNLDPIPGAAESWDISPNGLTYTFHLRPDLKWSDGQALTAKDFAYSFERALTPEVAAPNAYLLYVLKNAAAFYRGEVAFGEVGVKVVDERTLELQLSHPAPYLLSLLAHPVWFPVQHAAIATQGEALGRSPGWTRPGKFVGNGPFQLQDWKVNSYVHVVKNPHYWDAERTRLNQIFFYPTESREAEERAFRAGQLHLTEAMPVSKVGFYRDQDHPSLRIDPYLGTYYLQLNTRNPALADARVRQALGLAIDRDLIVESITRGGQKPAWHFTPPGTGGYTPDISGSKNVEMARQLLAQAGYAGGEGFPGLTYLYNTSENNKAIAEALQQMWRKNLGLSVELINQEWKVYTHSRETGQFDILRSSWIGDYLDATSFLGVWSSESGNNFTGWKSASYDNFLSRARLTTVAEKRFEIFARAEELLMREQPILPLYFYTSVYLKRQSVKGYYPTLLNYHPWKFVYLE